MNINSVCFVVTVFLASFSVLGVNAQDVKTNLPTIQFALREIPLPGGGQITAEFGLLKVPENRLKNNSKAIDLAVLRLQTKSTNPAPPLIYLAGGPGGSAISEARIPFMFRLFEKILRTRDVVLMDQRGTGQSKPAITWQPTEPVPPDVFSSQQKAVEFFRQWHQLAIDSFHKRGIDLSGYNSVESAHDINDLRLAIGANKVSLLAFSYGTHLGLATIRLYSKHLDSAVLIGTEGMNDTFKLPSVYDTQIRKISSLAAQDPNINGEVPDMTTLLKKVLTKLEHQPVNLSIMNQTTKEEVSVQIGKVGLQYFIRRDAGDSSDFVWFPALLYLIDGGDYSLLRKIAEKRYNEGIRGVSGMVMMINLFSGATADRIKRITKEAKTAMLGNVVNLPEMFVADLWGNPSLGNKFRDSFPSDTRTLFISGSLDSNAPADQAEKLQKKFSNSEHLVIDYAGHEDILPNEKVQEVIVNFLGGRKARTEPVIFPKPKFKPISDIPGRVK